MCLSKPKVPEVKPAPLPVNMSPIGDDLAPTLVAASDVDGDVKKKAKKKSGTSSLNTTAGVNTTTSAGSVNIA